MKAPLIALLLAAAGLMAMPPRLSQTGKLSADGAFQRFWASSSPSEAEGLTPAIIASGVRFDEAWKRLKAGRQYQPQKSGVVILGNETSDGASHYFAVNVPKDYDPAKSYQLRFQLHGGVSGRADNQPRGSGDIGQLAGPTTQFYVLPYAWNKAPWWSEDQVLNLGSILDQVKRAYNIDENRVVVSGVSDGGTGTYYIAMRETTPFAAFLPLNGYVLLLADDLIDDGRAFPANLLNKPFFIVNGGRDPLYPSAIVEPSIKDMSDAGVEIAYHPQPNAGHETSWWPSIKADFEAFVAEHKRNPNPERVTWETNDLQHNRAHWLVIDKLNGNDNRPAILLGPAPLDMFFRKGPSGRITAIRSGNRIVVMTKGVSEFTLLLSPDVIDFDQPVEVIVNGHSAFQRRVEKSVETLLKWAARDNDRTMLYAAELHLSASGSPQQ